MGSKITSEVLESYLLCSLKGYLKFAGERGSKSEYECLANEICQSLHESTAKTLFARLPELDNAQGAPIDLALLKRGSALIVDAVIETPDASLAVDGLKRVNGASHLGDFHYLPVLFGQGPKARPVEKRVLEVCGLLLGEIQGHVPAKGLFVDPEGARFTGHTFEANLRNARALVERLREMQQADTPPPLTLNAHCHVCEFRDRCVMQAKASDDVSLLRGLAEKEIGKLRRRGIATVTQLSYTYRARRASMHARQRTVRHSFALQALAIREKKIFVLGDPALPQSAVRVYFDIEGDVNKASAYLIGMIDEREALTERFSFWADGECDETRILNEFLNVLEGLGDYRLFCYGDFELAFLRRMRQSGWEQRVTPVLERTTNVLSLIYASFYFPVYSNGLKEIAGHLGFRWSEPSASGLQCVVWRMHWEQRRDYALKLKIETYNLDDCAALQTIVGFLRRAGTPARSDGAVSDEITGARFSKVVEMLPRYRRPSWGEARFSISDFQFINELAYFDYQRDRVYVRGPGYRRKRRPRARTNAVWTRIKPETEIEIRCHECPTCKNPRLTEWPDGRLSRVVSDLRITPRGIRRRYLRVTSARYRCPGCRRTFASPEYYRVDRFSHSLKSWAIYEHVAHRTSLGILSESFRDCFGLSIGTSDIHEFKALMARYYSETYEALLAKIIAGRLIQADETEVEIKGIGKAYVWVLTSLDEVIFMHRPNREGDFFHKLLADFKGVLVSDFYSAYDSLPCAQQKCLIHLIRDFNNDIVSHPFDDELKHLAAQFGRVLRDTVSTIDQHGLRARHLRKHKPQVERFFQTVAGAVYRSYRAQAYQVRLEKGRNTLFTFLDHDGVPWNNNNAEHAVKVFAYYRVIADGMFTESSLKDHLTLLSIYQTCAYKAISFLKFLVSQERDIDRFVRRGRRIVEPAPCDLYPEGYAPLKRRRRSPENGSTEASHRAEDESRS